MKKQVRKFKKILCFVLMFMLILTMTPAVAFAAEKAEATTMALAEIEGSAEITNANGKALTYKQGMGLYSGYSIKTDKGSYAYISLDSTKAVKLDELTQVSIEKSGKRLEVKLASGELFFNVTEKLSGNESLNITTSNMTTGIRGTSGVATQWHGKVEQVVLFTGEAKVKPLQNTNGIEEQTLRPFEIATPITAQAPGSEVVSADTEVVILTDANAVDTVVQTIGKSFVYDELTKAPENDQTAQWGSETYDTLLGEIKQELDQKKENLPQDAGTPKFDIEYNGTEAPKIIEDETPVDMSAKPFDTERQADVAAKENEIEEHEVATASEGTTAEPVFEPKAEPSGGGSGGGSGSGGGQNIPASEYAAVFTYVANGQAPYYDVNFFIDANGNPSVNNSWPAAGADGTSPALSPEEAWLIDTTIPAGAIIKYTNELTSSVGVMSGKKILFENKTGSTAILGGVNVSAAEYDTPISDNNETYSLQGNIDYYFDGNFKIDGTANDLSIEDDAKVTLRQGSKLIIADPDSMILVNGSLLVEYGAILDLTNSSLYAYSSAYQFENRGTIKAESAEIDTLRNAETGTFETSGLLHLSGAKMLDNTGTMTLGSLKTDQSTSQVFSSDGTITNKGTITVNDEVYLYIEEISNETGATLNFETDGNVFFALYTNLKNKGTVSISNKGTVSMWALNNATTGNTDIKTDNLNFIIADVQKTFLNEGNLKISSGFMPTLSSYPTAQQKIVAFENKGNIETACGFDLSNLHSNYVFKQTSGKIYTTVPFDTDPVVANNQHNGFEFIGGEIGKITPESDSSKMEIQMMLDHVFGRDNPPYQQVADGIYAIGDQIITAEAVASEVADAELVRVVFTNETFQDPGQDPADTSNIPDGYDALFTFVADTVPYWQLQFSDGILNTEAVAVDQDHPPVPVQNFPYDAIPTQDSNSAFAGFMDSLPYASQVQGKKILLKNDTAITAGIYTGFGGDIDYDLEGDFEAFSTFTVYEDAKLELLSGSTLNISDTNSASMIVQGNFINRDDATITATGRVATDAGSGDSGRSKIENYGVMTLSYEAGYGNQITNFENHDGAIATISNLQPYGSDAKLVNRGELNTTKIDNASGYTIENYGTMTHTGMVSMSNGTFTNEVGASATFGNEGYMTLGTITNKGTMSFKTENDIVLGNVTNTGDLDVVKASNLTFGDITNNDSGTFDVAEVSNLDFKDITNNSAISVAKASNIFIDAINNNQDGNMTLTASSIKIHDDKDVAHNSLNAGNLVMFATGSIIIVDAAENITSTFENSGMLEVDNPLDVDKGNTFKLSGGQYKCTYPTLQGEAIVINDGASLDYTGGAFMKRVEGDLSQELRMNPPENGDISLYLLELIFGYDIAGAFPSQDGVYSIEGIEVSATMELEPTEDENAPKYTWITVEPAQAPTP